MTLTLLCGVIGGVNAGASGFFCALALCGVLGGSASCCAVKGVNEEISGIRNWTNKYTDITGWYEPETDSFHRQYRNGGGELIPLKLWTPYKDCFSK